MAEQYDQSADGREIKLEVGEEFEIALGENASTGFQWQTVADGSPACKLLKDEFRAPTDGRPGQGGRHVWQFRAVQAGQGQIELSEGRAGREGATAGRGFKLRVRVAKS